ncbi:MAG: GIY-YIG nuclease family protein [bacterium]|nr:GIY-YIG nuclease family protein [bacterium]
MFTVYAIVSKSNCKIYIGQTADLEARLKQHNALDETHLSQFTRQNKGPWKLVHKEDYQTRQEALKREKQLKSYRGREFIKNLIQNIRP